MAKTARGAYRHIEEWSSFFSDAAEISSLLIEEFVENHKRKKYLRQSLDRLVRRGFLVQREKSYVTTKIGIRFFLRHSQQKIPLAPKEGKWYLLSFDIPVKLNPKREALRRLLKDFGFQAFQKSVWIGRHQLGENVWEFIVAN